MSHDNDKTVNKPGESEEEFLSRWSRRKLEAERAGRAADEPVAASELNADGAGETEPARVLTDEDMPDLDELGEESDYSGFLSPGVSDHLRRAALRKLFSSAKFNVCDGLDDYAEDYSKFIPLGDVVTADMRFRMERALEKLSRDEEADAADPEGARTLAAGQDDGDSGSGDEPIPDGAEQAAIPGDPDDDDDRA